VILCLRSFGLLLSAVLIAVLLRPVVSGYHTTTRFGDPQSSVLKASKITNEDARYHYLLGLLYQRQADGKQFREAIDNFRLSLQRDPTRAFTWLALSKAYSGYGDHKWAEYAARKAVTMDRANPKVIWETGMFFLTQGQLQEAAPYLRKYLSLVPSGQEDLYTMLHATGVRPSFLLEQVLPSQYQLHNRYFRFLMAYKQNRDLSEVWERRDSWKPAQAEHLAYCDFLIEDGRLREAADVWTEFIQRNYPGGVARDSSNMIFNGDFEYPLQNGGFDWKIGNADGVQIARDKDIKKSGQSSLSARFSGKTNPGIYAAQQVVAVRPKQQYRISGQIKTGRLTTRNGILLEVLGQNCPTLAVRSEVVTGTHDWMPLELAFTTPADCTLVKIGIKRERSEKFDNKISGDVWLDEFSMTEINSR
jgi:tetratricopeptide (TPR) repeat protein